MASRGGNPRSTSPRIGAAVAFPAIRDTRGQRAWVRPGCASRLRSISSTTQGEACPRFFHSPLDRVGNPGAGDLSDIASWVIAATGPEGSRCLLLPTVVADRRCASLGHLRRTGFYAK